MFEVKGRFAPSPTGRMHLGNVYAALLSWLSSKSKGGRWLLRIEDIDPQRSKQVYADQLMRDLEWLGLEWDEGPFYQSQRGELYEGFLRELTAKGLTYPCYCTRADILATQAPHESDGRVVYKGTCRGLSSCEGVTAAIRLKVPDEDISFVDGHYGCHSVNLSKHCGDFILRRKDKAWAYQLAVVADDALMGVTEVVRGCDLLLSVAQQLYLYSLLGFGDRSPQFIHAPLLCNKQGQRLSKRDMSLDISCLREKYSAEGIIGLIASYAGLKSDKSPVSAADLIADFTWENVPNENILVDF